jgi:hypothetical protein
MKQSPRLDTQSFNHKLSPNYIVTEENDNVETE